MTTLAWAAAALLLAVTLFAAFVAGAESSRKVDSVLAEPAPDEDDDDAGLALILPWPSR